MQCATKSSGRVKLKEPRKDLARGVLVLATITASLIVAPVVKFDFQLVGRRWAGPFVPLGKLKSGTYVNLRRAELAHSDQLVGGGGFCFAPVGESLSLIGKLL